jgi:hypothetical protein
MSEPANLQAEKNYRATLLISKGKRGNNACRHQTYTFPAANDAAARENLEAYIKDVRDGRETWHVQSLARIDVEEQVTFIQFPSQF